MKFGDLGRGEEGEEGETEEGRSGGGRREDGAVRAQMGRRKGGVRKVVIYSGGVVGVKMEGVMIMSPRRGKIG